MTSKPFYILQMMAGTPTRTATDTATEIDLRAMATNA